MKKRLRILHAPVNIAGQATTISRAQRALGYKSDVLIYYHHHFKYECDIDLRLKNIPFLISGLILLKTFLICIPKYDVFHFHYGFSFLPFKIDLWILRKLNKKVLMHYWGSDVIQTDIALDLTLWSKEDLTRIYPTIDNDQKRKKLAKISRLVDVTVVGDACLLPYSKKSTVINKAIDLNKFPFIGDKQVNKKIRIVHAPTNRDVKGTKFILEAIKKLKAERYDFEFILVEKKSNKEALKIYKKADIVVDAVLQGIYGVLAVECMALGKPVLCHIDHKFSKYYKNLPIVVTTPDTIYENLVKLIQNPELRERLGKQGRKYVQANHDSIVIAKSLIKLYKKL